MPNEYPEWIFTHKAWADLKKRNKDEQFPKTGAGKALEKAEALYKKIKWSEFESFIASMTSTQRQNSSTVQDFYKLHAIYINPFIKAVDAARTVINKSVKPPMPETGRRFAGAMKTQCGKFALDGDYFSSLAGQISAYNTLKDKINATARQMLAADILDVIKNKNTRAILLDHEDTQMYVDSIYFLMAYIDREDPEDIYEKFIKGGSRYEINTSNENRLQILGKIHEGSLRPNDLEPLVAEIAGLVRTSNPWPRAVERWKTKQLAKYKLR